MPVLVKAKDFVLKGSIHVKNGSSFPYHLVISIKGSQVSGYSVTRLKNGAQPRTPVKGSINKKTQILTFTEYPNDTGGQDAITCFVHASVSFKQINNKYQIKGFFKGKDHFDVYCGEGTISFHEPAAIDQLLGLNLQPGETHVGKTVEKAHNYSHDAVAVHQQKKKHVRVVDTTHYFEHGKEYEITSGRARQFHWHSDTCILDVYDGGVIDGDIISVLLNADEILTRHVLTKQKHQIKLYLKGKVNTLSIIAENLGKTPPNTANIVLSDGKWHYKIKAFNDIGESAEVMLKKR